MDFDIKKTLLYSDTLLPDVFISEYLPLMNGESLKIYIYCMFLDKYKKNPTPLELSRKLEISVDKVQESLDSLQSLGLIIQKNDKIIFHDLKERAILSMYRLKHSSDPDDISSSDKNKKRNKVINSINNKFFQGVMAPSWYTDIDSWFDRFKFEDDAIYMLFQHCYDHGVLQKNYILKVAESWYNKGITTSIDVEKYYEEYKRVKDIRYKIVKNLKLNRNLTSYEEEIVEKWVVDYNYNFDVIEMGLRKTTGKTNPSFNYINSILESWNKEGLKTKEQVSKYLSSTKNKYSKNKTKENTTTKSDYKNFEHRDYLDKDFDNFYYKFDNQ